MVICGRRLEVFVVPRRRFDSQKARHLHEVEFTIAGLGYWVSGNFCVHEIDSQFFPVRLLLRLGSAVVAAFVVARVEVLVIEFARRAAAESDSCRDRSSTGNLRRLLVARLEVARVPE